MRREEALYISDFLNDIDFSENDILLNIGSASEQFRTIDQQHIHNSLFKPLASRNIRVVHTDLKEVEGVDIVGDIFDSQIQAKIRKLKPKVVLLCNIMEHLRVDLRTMLPAVINDLAVTGTIVVVTVPRSYPLHNDPIDTYFRPTLEDLRLMFSSFEEVDAKVVDSTTFLNDFLEYNRNIKLKYLIRLVTPFYRPKTWICITHNLFWLFRVFKVSCIILRKT